MEYLMQLVQKLELINCPFRKKGHIRTFLVLLLTQSISIPPYLHREFVHGKKGGGQGIHTAQQLVINYTVEYLNSLMCNILFPAPTCTGLISP